MLKLNPDDLEITTFATRPDDGGGELAAAQTQFGISCPYSCQICRESDGCGSYVAGCTSPGYNC